MITYYAIQHYQEPKSTTWSNGKTTHSGDKWVGSSFDHFGTPPGFSASDKCWQDIQRHGVYSINEGLAGLDWISEKHPETKFRLVKVEFSKPVVCVVERPEPEQAPVESFFELDGPTPTEDDMPRIKEYLNGLDIPVLPEHLQTPDKVLAAIDANKAYPNVQASGKIKVDTPEQSEAVQRVLFGMGFAFEDGGQDVSFTNRPFIMWYEVHGRKVLYLNNTYQTFEDGTQTEHHLADFGLSETKPLTVSDFPLGQRVEHEAYGKGEVVKCPLGEDDDSVPVKFDNEKTLTRYFRISTPHTPDLLSNLTKLPTPKPFGPEDDQQAAYDQDGNEWDYIHVGRTGNYVRMEDVDMSEISICVNPDGTTATALKFTREKPEQCPA